MGYKLDAMDFVIQFIVGHEKKLDIQTRKLHDITQRHELLLEEVMDKMNRLETILNRLDYE